MAHLTMFSSRIFKLNSLFDRNQLFTSNNSTFLRSYQYHQYHPKRLQTSNLKAHVSSTLTTENSDSSLSYQPQLELQNEGGEKFDWYAQWYPVMPVCELDKRVPCAKRVMGVDVVVWWDKNESQWNVFNDMCPHRLAPLSEGRIDELGRLQCVYHGWCFNGSGQCKLIPQAPPDGPTVNAMKKACVAVYPSSVQNGIVWFWPNSDPKFRDILNTRQPPFLPELDDPSYHNNLQFYCRDLDYGYEILMENFMDPSHLPYAHYGLLSISPPENREGGGPMNMNVLEMDINGYTGNYESGVGKFIAPCVYAQDMVVDEDDGSFTLGKNDKDSSVMGPSLQRRAILIFICVPVSPGKSRAIVTFPRNFAAWTDLIIPRWIVHLNQNIVLDSDLYFLHCEEKKIKELGPRNWQRVCFVPTKADGFVIGFRRWLNKYSEGEVEWRANFSGGALPPTPPRKQLLDRYWNHTVNCASCNAVYKRLNLAEKALQVTAFCLIGAVGLTSVQRSVLFLGAIMCFAASKWLSRFIYKNFHFHDFNHALK